MPLNMIKTIAINNTAVTNPKKVNVMEIKTAGRSSVMH